MKLHEEKFELLNYRGSQSKNKVFLAELPFINESLIYQTSDCDIYPSAYSKDLGVYVSSDLAWSTHVNQITEDAKKMSSWVLSVFTGRAPDLMLSLHKSMVRSMIEYSCPVWNPSTIPDIQKLESTQRSFTRHISGCHGLTYWERLKRLDLLSLQRRRERYIIIHVWKIIHGEAPNDISLSYHHHPRLGIKCNVPNLPNAAPRSAKTAFDNSFAVKGPQLWNILPPEINSMESLDTFKRRLTSFVKDRFPDTPPVFGYTGQNSNSLLEWAVVPSSCLQQIA